MATTARQGHRCRAAIIPTSLGRVRYQIILCSTDWTLNQYHLRHLAAFTRITWTRHRAVVLHLLCQDRLSRSLRHSSAAFIPHWVKTIISRSTKTSLQYSEFHPNHLLHQEFPRNNTCHHPIGRHQVKPALQAFRDTASLCTTTTTTTSILTTITISS